MLINPASLVPNLTIAGRTFTNLTNLIILTGPTENAVSSSRTTLRKPSESAGYQVTTGKTLIIYAVRLISTAGSFSPYFAYTDNDVGIAGNTAFTSPVYLAGLSPSSDPFFFATSNAAGSTLELALDFKVPSQKYFSIDSNSSTVSGSVTAYGYET